MGIVGNDAFAVWAFEPVVVDGLVPPFVFP